MTGSLLVATPPAAAEAEVVLGHREPAQGLHLLVGAHVRDGPPPAHRGRRSVQCRVCHRGGDEEGEQEGAGRGHHSCHCLWWYGEGEGEGVDLVNVYTYSVGPSTRCRIFFNWRKEWECMPHISIGIPRNDIV